MQVPWSFKTQNHWSVILFNRSDYLLSTSTVLTTFIIENQIFSFSTYLPQNIPTTTITTTIWVWPSRKSDIPELENNIVWSKLQWEYVMTHLLISKTWQISHIGKVPWDTSHWFYGYSNWRSIRPPRLNEDRLTTLYTIPFPLYTILHGSGGDNGKESSIAVSRNGGRRV